jgi:hypothetical protein
MPITFEYLVEQVETKEYAKNFEEHTGSCCNGEVV